MSKTKQYTSPLLDSFIVDEKSEEYIKVKEDMLKQCIKKPST